MKKFLSMTAMLALVFSFNISMAAVEVNNCTDLKTQLGLNSNIELTSDFTCTGTITGPLVTTYTGTFDGNNHTISGIDVSVDRATSTGVNYIGLIGTNNGTIKDLTLQSPTLTITGDSNTTIFGAGILVGLNNGVIDNVHITNPSITIGVNAGQGEFNGFGVITGFNSATGSITNSSVTNIDLDATGNVMQNIGGISGYNQGTISNSYATGIILADKASNVGGIVGGNIDGAIESSFFAGNITGRSKVGGVAGSSSNGTISDVYSTGTITASGKNSSGTTDQANAIAGGLVGVIYNTTITNSITEMDINITSATSTGGYGQVVGCESAAADFVGCTTTSTYASTYNNTWGAATQSVTGGSGNNISTTTNVATEDQLNNPSFWTGILTNWSDVMFDNAADAAAVNGGNVPTTTEIATDLANDNAGGSVIDGTTSDATITGTEETHTYAPSLNFMQKIAALFSR